MRVRVIVLAACAAGCAAEGPPPGTRMIHEVPGYPSGLAVDGDEILVPTTTASGRSLVAVGLAHVTQRVVSPVDDAATLFEASGGEALFGDAAGLWWVDRDGPRRLVGGSVTAATARDGSVLFARPSTSEADPVEVASIVHADATLWSVPVAGGPAVELRGGLHFVDDVAAEAGEILYVQRLPPPWGGAGSPAWVARGPLTGADGTWTVDGWMAVAVEAGDGRPWALLSRVAGPGCRLVRWDPSQAAWATLVETERHCGFSHLAVRGDLACFTDGEDFLGESLTCWSERGTTPIASRRLGITALAIGDDVVVWADRVPHGRSVVLLAADLPP